MAKAHDMRVPLTEVLGVPGFLYGTTSFEEWCRVERVDVQEDWNGRPSVDLPTAWRIKEKYDAMLAKSTESNRRALNENHDIHLEQQRREERLGRALATKRGQRPEKMLQLARMEVLEEEKHLDIPANIRKRLVWSNGAHLTF